MSRYIFRPNEVDTFDWEREIRQVLVAPEELGVVFEEFHGIGSGSVLAVEALTRSHRVGSRELFQRASELGLDAHLEWLALTRLIARYQELDLPMRMSVNVSPKALITGVVQELLLPLADRLIIEISELSPIVDYVALSSALKELRSRGVWIALDNAGAGFGGLNLLLALRPEWVKIDRSLVERIDISHRSRTVVEALIAIAHRIGSRVIAVGVELDAERETIESLGCDAWQGFLALQTSIPSSRHSCVGGLVHHGSMIGDLSFVVDATDSVAEVIRRWSVVSHSPRPRAALVSEGGEVVGSVCFDELVTAFLDAS
ncbi:MAG: EAL domain-containing protein [Ferrimicrobium sp.]